METKSNDSFDAFEDKQHKFDDSIKSKEIWNKSHLNTGLYS